MEASTLSGLNVLLVEDDLFFAARLTAGLAKYGCRFKRVDDADSAVRTATEMDPEIVIVNLGSRRFGGVELVRRLRQEGNSRRILAFLSHLKIPSVRAEALAAGADMLVANSAISMRLPNILQELLSEQPLRHASRKEN